MRVAHRAVLAAAVASLGVACVAEERESRTYVERLGADTMSIERFTRTANGIEGELVARSPVTRTARYVVDLSADGGVERLEVEWETPPEIPDGPPSQHAVMIFEGDSATMAVREGEEADTVRVPVVSRTIPGIGRVIPPIGIVELVVQAAAASGEDVYEYDILSPGQPQTASNRISRVTGNEVSFDLFGSPMYVRLDTEGKIVAVSGRETTMKIEVERAEGVTSEALADLTANFAARDVAGQGIGTPSPQAIVQESGGGASFEIMYSRPAMRGRQIWGGLVPYDEVWRTGANAATHFSTDRDLTIGDAEVPAGSYTLWTTFTPESATLIINLQIQIWGTAYDSRHDLGRVPLERESLEAPAERFTIKIEGTEDGGILRLSWDRSRFSVPLRVR